MSRVIHAEDLMHMSVTLMQHRMAQHFTRHWFCDALLTDEMHDLLMEQAYQTISVSAGDKLLTVFTGPPLDLPGAEALSTEVRSGYWLYTASDTYQLDDFTWYADEDEALRHYREAVDAEYWDDVYLFHTDEGVLCGVSKDDPEMDYEIDWTIMDEEDNYNG